MMAETELQRRADDLVGVLRTMRKWGFTIIQDRPGISQAVDAQMLRARIVAAELLGCGADGNTPEVDSVAQVLLQTAEAGRQLLQFK